MTLYVCGSETCGLKFVYASKHTVTTRQEQVPVGVGTLTKPEMETEVETRHCPFCDSKDFTEYVEPVASSRSVVSVEHGKWEVEKDKEGNVVSGGAARINALIKQGYEINEKFSGVKSVVLFKYLEEAKEAEKE